MSVNIYNAISGSGSTNFHGIKTMKVYYDTLLLNVKARDFAAPTTQLDFVLLEKINFDYDENLISLDNKGIVLNFGNNVLTGASRSTGTCYVDTILLEKSKKLLVCGLSSLSANVTNNINGDVVTGSSYIPIVYEYDINKHEVTKLFPTETDDIDSWKHTVMGTFDSNNNIPLISYNSDKHTLNYFYKSTLTANTSALRNIVNISFDYKDGLQLNSFRQLTGLNIATIGTPQFTKMRSYEDDHLITGYTSDGINTYTIPFKLSDA